MDINIKIIPHSEQRYETVGDWWFEPGEGRAVYKSLEIRVSAMGNSLYEFCVAQHEQTEAMLCLRRNIPEAVVTEFDKEYERRRLAGVMSCQGEPGDHPNAPYKKEHFFATSIERLISAELGVDWRKYDEAVESL